MYSTTRTSSAIAGPDPSPEVVNIHSAFAISPRMRPGRPDVLRATRTASSSDELSHARSCTVAIRPRLPPLPLRRYRRWAAPAAARSRGSCIQQGWSLVHTQDVAPGVYQLASTPGYLRAHASGAASPSLWPSSTACVRVHARHVRRTFFGDHVAVAVRYIDVDPILKDTPSLIQVRQLRIQGLCRTSSHVPRTSLPNSSRQHTNFNPSHISDRA
ncbi:hypothetical protein OH76DRAFT_724154 [Lentinus brumalis]|uniref:Uncharacterized protein n=1 Tax=Lentinus brumalis TaxID=2498619 RepID=A0A371D513_9APHY|nr:hypothetical protein OH76DRAFT_724154 [Polyporus brumalis]